MMNGPTLSDAFADAIFDRGFGIVTFNTKGFLSSSINYALFQLLYSRINPRFTAVKQIGV
jgi:hypothetical protein